MSVPGDVALLLGRVILGGYFVLAGWAHFRDRAAMTRFAASKRVPFPAAAILGTGALLVLGGTSVALGAFPLAGLGMLALFLIGVTPKVHDFWTLADPAARTAELASFLRNSALLGALLILGAAQRPWPWSLPGGP